MKEYAKHSYIECIDDYVYPSEKKFDNGLEWSECRNCGLKPKVWTFDNGRSTACGCWESRYDHFSVNAESIMSVHYSTNGKDIYDHFSVNAESIMSVHYSTNGKDMTQYDSDELRRNWNHWCDTGEVLFEHAGKRSDGRW